MRSFRMTKRDWRTKEFRFLMLAIIIAVASISSVGFFTQRMHAGLERDAHQLLGADLLVASDYQIPERWEQHAEELHLQVARTVVFPSMASAGVGDDAKTLLVSLKAVSDAYPLRGKVKLRQPDTNSSEQDITADHIPASGTIWVDSILLTQLQIHIGDKVTLGEAEFTVGGVIRLEPDRENGFLSLAPRIIMPITDLPETGLIQFGSRVTYRLLLAGSPQAIIDFQGWATDRIKKNGMKGIRVETIDSSRPTMRATLDRAEQFLSLVALLSAMLAAIAIAMAARQFMLKRVSDFAMLRCLGMKQLAVLRLYLIEFFIIGCIGCMIGLAIGFAAHFALIGWLGKFLPATLPPVGLMPAIQGVIIGLLILFGFAVPPILQLRDVPYNQVIHHDHFVPKTMTWLSYVLGGIVFCGLLWWQASDIKLALITGVGFIGGFVLFALFAWLMLKVIRRIRHYITYQSWHFAVTGLQRRGGSTILQIIALSLGLMALLLLAVIRGDLVDAWLKTTPADAPNRFIFNIQPDQVAQLDQTLKTAHIDTPLFPMIRGRLLSVNGKTVSTDDYPDIETKRLVDREFNLSTMREMQKDNTLLDGKWFDDTQPEASVEESIAKRLKLHLGDQLTFDVAGQQIEAKMTSIRRIEWESMHPNFFVIINPQVMQNLPETLITSYYLPDDQSSLDVKLTQLMPNLSIINLSSLLEQIRLMAVQVIKAVEFLFIFTLIAGLFVLYAALMGSHAERIREAALFRALGATKKQLNYAQWIEFGLIGAISGVLASTGAAVIGWILAKEIFKFNWVFSPAIWLGGIIIGILCAFLGGWFGVRHVTSQPPLSILREN